MFREELRRLAHWEERHRRLTARLVLLFAATVLLDVAGAVAVYFLERHAKQTDVHSFGQALFFSSVQVLTVSSSLKNPITPGGRAVDIVLELWAVTAVTGSAGAIAAFFRASDSS